MSSHNLTGPTRDETACCEAVPERHITITNRYVIWPGHTNTKRHNATAEHNLSSPRPDSTPHHCTLPTLGLMQRNWTRQYHYHIAQIST